VGILSTIGSASYEGRQDGVGAVLSDECKIGFW